jgi:hypothetical protein
MAVPIPISVAILLPVRIDDPLWWGPVAISRRLGCLGQCPGAQVQEPLQVALVARRAGAVLEERGEQADGGVYLGEDEASHNVARIAQYQRPQAQRAIENVILGGMSSASLVSGQE